MVEVFKTNVKDRMHANRVIEQVHQVFAGYKANFDLDDCDSILRVKSMMGPVESCRLIQLLKELGFEAEILPDIVSR